MNGDRLLGLGATGTTLGPIHNFDLAAQAATERLRPILREADFFRGASFRWVCLFVRFGAGTDRRPVYTGRSKKHGDIDFAVSLDRIAWNNLEPDAAADVLTIVTIDVLLAVADRYSLPQQALRSERRRYMKSPSLDARAMGLLAAAPGEIVEPSGPFEQEVHLFLPLSSPGFGAAADLDLVRSLDRALDAALREAEVGYLDIQQMGAGSAEFVMAGEDAGEVARVARSVLGRFSLPPGAHLLLVRDPREADEAERVDLV